MCAARGQCSGQPHSRHTAAAVQLAAVKCQRRKQGSTVTSEHRAAAGQAVEAAAHRAERVAVLRLPPRPQPVVHRLALLVRLVELALGERGLQLAQHLQAKEPCVAAAVSGGRVAVQRQEQPVPLFELSACVASQGVGKCITGYRSA